MDMKLLEITDNDPTRILIVGQITRIATGLLEWGEKGAVRLFVPLLQINVEAFLLDQNTGSFNVAVYETGMAQLYRKLELDILIRFFYSIDFLKQGNPEQLSVLLFVSASSPILGKLLCCKTLFVFSHNSLPLILRFEPIRAWYLFLDIIPQARR